MRTYITFTFTGGLQTTSRTNTFFSFFHTPVPHPLETPRVGFSTCFPTTAEVTLGRSLQYSSNALTITTDTWDEKKELDGRYNKKPEEETDEKLSESRLLYLTYSPVSRRSQLELPV